MGHAMHEARRRALRRALLAAAPAWLAGCSLAQGPRQEFHPLRDGGGSGQAAAASARIDKVLLVSAQAPPGVYGSDRMVFSKDGHSRSYFQFGFWSERPAQTLLTLAEARLARSQRFSAVAARTAGVRGDLLLSLRLDELYLDVSVEPARVRLGISAELVDWRQRTLLARQQLQQSVAVTQRDASGVAAGATQALGALLDELVPWVAAAAAV